MPIETVTGALCKCTMGAAPSSLVVLPIHKTMACSLPGGNVGDHIPFLNILPFGTCKSILCPTTAALTAAALGVLTPGPCIPMTVSPWSPGSPTVKIDGQNALNSKSKAACVFGGTVSITAPGQATVMVA